MESEIRLLHVQQWQLLFSLYEFIRSSKQENTHLLVFYLRNMLIFYFPLSITPMCFLIVIRTFSGVVALLNKFLTL